jgi:hypothetical protein
VKELYNVKHIIIFIFCIVSIVGCQGKPDTLSQETKDITSEITNADPVTNANADVIYVRAERDNDSTWTFSVTVQHPDTGWEDYADGWDIVLPDGEVIKPDPESEFTRTLLHPHVDEQPFTRSQSGIRIPSDVTIVRVRAHDLVDGFGGDEIFIDLTMDSGIGFEIIKK